jgi:hypothetical protein
VAKMQVLWRGFSLPFSGQDVAWLAIGPRSHSSVMHARSSQARGVSSLGGPQGGRGLGRFECRNCGMRFNASRTMYYHRSRCEGTVVNMVCSVCHKSFYRPERYRQHLLLHGIVE